MRCPNLNELPPVEGKFGFPWTEESSHLVDKKTNGEAWQKISIVTPNFNYGHFIEETIRSVLLQGYPNLEYIIIDGGSTDNSVEIIKKYEPWITYWVSEKDKGQANAINKGLKKCTGEIFNWINSDDILAPNCLKNVAQNFSEADLVAGKVINFDEKSNRTVNENSNLDVNSCLSLTGKVAMFHQPGIWLRTTNVFELGLLREDLCYSFDWDLLVKYLCLFDRVNYIDEDLVYFRVHSTSKTVYNPPETELERNLSISDILKDPKYTKAHYKGHDFLKLRKWYAEVRKINSSNKSKFLKVINLLFNLVLYPNIARARFTVGAILKLIK